MQTELPFTASPEPEVWTLGQFMARGGYDSEISHDRLRFPHGISKRQARDNRRAAGHHLFEAIRGISDYEKAVADGLVRPPTEAENHRATLAGHPDRQDTQAAWRVSIKRLVRRGVARSDLEAIEKILAENLGGIDPWADLFGGGESLAAMATARAAWVAASRTVPVETTSA